MLALALSNAVHQSRSLFSLLRSNFEFPEKTTQHSEEYEMATPRRARQRLLIMKIHPSPSSNPRSREPRPVGRCGDRQISTARGATAVLCAAHAQVRARQASNVPNFECSKQRAASLRPLRWSSSPPCGAWLVISLSIRYCWDHEPGSFHRGAQRVLVLVQSCYSAAATDLGQTKCALRVSLLHVGYRQPCMFGSRR